VSVRPLAAAIDTGVYCRDLSFCDFFHAGLAPVPRSR